MNVERLWYEKQVFSYLLWPFSWIYRVVIAVRRALYRWNILQTVSLPVPVIVVGNITVGGSGKTPLVIFLANELQRQGWRPGIVSRGYRGDATESPQAVRPDSDPRRVGDEPVLLAQKTACPLIVCKNRVQAATTLLQKYDCNVVISDDGLQHLALGRHVEIAVIDGERRFGNGFCLPAGPLREPEQRLQTVDFLVSNGAARAGEWGMELAPGDIYQLIQPARRLAAADLQGKSVHAVAAIGNPHRFFHTLENLGFKIIPHPFPDHYFFQKSDLDFGDDAVIIMTEKDAVKCRPFAADIHWCLAVRAKLPELFLINLTKKLAQ